MWQARLACATEPLTDPARENRIFECALICAELWLADGASYAMLHLALCSVQEASYVVDGKPYFLFC